MCHSRARCVGVSMAIAHQGSLLLSFITEVLPVSRREEHWKSRNVPLLEAVHGNCHPDS